MYASHSVMFRAYRYNKLGEIHLTFHKLISAGYEIWPFSFFSLCPRAFFVVGCELQDFDDWCRAYILHQNEQPISMIIMVNAK